MGGGEGDVAEQRQRSRRADWPRGLTKSGRADVLGKGVADVAGVKLCRKIFSEDVVVDLWGLALFGLGCHGFEITHRARVRSLIQKYGTTGVERNHYSEEQVTVSHYRQRVGVRRGFTETRPLSSNHNAPVSEHGFSIAHKHFMRAVVAKLAKQCSCKER